MKSKKIPANKIIPNANPHKNNGFPLGLYWKIDRPQTAYEQIINISNPVKTVIVLNLNNNKLTIAKMDIPINEKAKTRGYKNLSSIFLKNLCSFPFVIKEYLPFVKIIDLR